MKKLLLFLFFATSFCFAQNQNNFWYFGEYTGVDFNSGIPVTVTNSVMLASEGSASISDTLGNLLFYTDGITVWNSNHQQMQQGFGLFGNLSSTQSALIVPKPQNCDRYFIFTVGVEDSLAPLCYSTVDMSFNAGLGKVISKNTNLSTGVTERLCATLKSNGNGYWIAAQQSDSSNFLIYSVSATNVNTTPQTFASSSPTSAGVQHINSRGEMKFSKSGNKIAYASYGLYHCVVCDFDVNNGYVSGCYTLNQSLRPWGLEFSPDDSKLFVSLIEPPYSLIQYDLLAGSTTAIQSSEQTIFQSTAGAPWNFGGCLQLGPDNKIYADRNLKHYLGVVNQPNLSGILCNYVDSAVFLSNRCQLGLPNCIKQYSPCSTIIGINEFESPSHLEIYNSYDGVSTLLFPNKLNEIFSLHVYNSCGQRIQTFENISGDSFTFELQHKTGIAFFQLTNGKVNYTGKLFSN